MTMTTVSGRDDRAPSRHSLFSATRDLKAARRFFRGTREVGHAPDWVTTDGHDAYLRTICGTPGREVLHRRSRYVNNRLEQDRRGVKRRSYRMRGFGSFDAATRFCTVHDELHDYFGPRSTTGEAIPLAEQRQLFRDRWSALMNLMVA